MNSANDGDVLQNMGQGGDEDQDVEDEEQEVEVKEDEGMEGQDHQDEGEEGENHENIVNLIQNAFASGSQIKDAGNLVKLIAKAVWTEKENMDRRTERSEDLESTFISEENVMKCEPCVNYVTSSNIPKALRKFHHGKNFGTVKKVRDNRKTLQRMRQHANSAIHKWAVKEYGAHKVQKKKHEEDTFEAAKNIVRNALFCLKDPEKSSFDFVKLNDLDNLKGLKNATINDGRPNFFALRNLVYEKLLVKIGETMKSTPVIGATLDKVTMNKVSYTVVLTYFFDDGGQIKWLLNDIYPNRSNEGIGEANAV